MKKAFAVFFAVLIVFTLSACGGKTVGDIKAPEEKYEAGQSVEAMLDYAKRLEESGNKEAAAAVYALIGKAAIADGINEGKTSVYEESPLSDADELLEVAKSVEGK